VASLSPLNLHQLVNKRLVAHQESVFAKPGARNLHQAQPAHKKFPIGNRGFFCADAKAGMPGQGKPILESRAVYPLGRMGYINYFMVVNDGIKNKAVFDLDMVHLDTHIECALLTQFSSGGRHTPFLEVLQHTKTYGDSDGMSFNEMLCRKLRRKLNHTSKYVQNATRVNGVQKIGTQLFNVSTEVLFEDNLRVGLIQAVLTASD
jgi:hypothetical protein